MKNLIILLLVSFVFPVIGGWEVNPECPDCKYPFNVSLQTNKSYILSNLQGDLENYWDGHFCQGALIDSKWILTLASCVDYIESPSDIWTEIGLHHLYDFSEIADSISINNIILHPNYGGTDSNWYYNYALIELSEESDYESIQLISDTMYEEQGDSVTVMGWGARYRTSGIWVMATELHENNNTIGECMLGWDDAGESIFCNTQFDIENYEEWDDLGDMIDEGYPGTACNGDEGAPLITYNNQGIYELVGNYYLGCSEAAPHQTKYTRTFIIKDWIYNYIGYPCEDGVFVNVSIVFDDNPDETSWELWYRGENPDVGYLYLVNSGNGSEQNICISDEGVYEFIIYDEGGDGLTEYPDGSYSVTLDTGGWGTPNEEIVANGGYFDFSDATLFAWPDSDGDLIINSQDTEPNNEFICLDNDQDGCDDCSMGYFDLENDCSYNLGDINLDGQINIIDVVVLVEYVLNEEYYSNADVNIDGIVNIVDIVTLVNIILNN